MDLSDVKYKDDWRSIDDTLGFHPDECWDELQLEDVDGCQTV